MYNAALKLPGSIMTLSKSADCSLDPISLFERLSMGSESTNYSAKDNRMLLESCEIDNKQQLKSILMNKAALRIECQGFHVSITSLTANGDDALNHLTETFQAGIIESKLHQRIIEIDYSIQSHGHGQLNCELDEESRLKRTTPIDCLRQIHEAFQSNNKSPFALFLCGLFSFDFIASFESLADVPFGENDCPDYVFYLAEELIVFDHQTRHTNIYSNVFSGQHSEKNYYEQSRRIEQLSQLMLTQQDNNNDFGNQHIDTNPPVDINAVTTDLSDQQYQEIVMALKKQIVAGNVFQVVPSRTFSLTCDNNLLSYQKLKESNPSPYMFYMQDQNFTLFGASPESALKYHKQTNKVDLYPIAGTRARGKNSRGEIDHDLDKRLEVELKLDMKENAEHMMLVDLARNDIARISNLDSLQIPRLLEVDRYSQVMHLVSCVQGELKPELDCFHAYQACMNMGTLTGAPKIKATELIRTTEKKRRGSYGGAVGYINTQGDMDTCIVIRSAFCKQGAAYIQAGAGIVFDSDPKSESDETRSKANAVIFAIQQANKQNSYDCQNSDHQTLNNQSQNDRSL